MPDLIDFYPSNEQGAALREVHQQYGDLLAAALPLTQDSFGGLIAATKAFAATLPQELVTLVEAVIEADNAGGPIELDYYDFYDGFPLSAAGLIWVGRTLKNVTTVHGFIAWAKAFDEELKDAYNIVQDTVPSVYKNGVPVSPIWD